MPFSRSFQNLNFLAHKTLRSHLLSGARQNLSSKKCCVNSIQHTQTPRTPFISMASCHFPQTRLLNSQNARNGWSWSKETQHANARCTSANKPASQCMNGSTGMTVGRFSPKTFLTGLNIRKRKKNTHEHDAERYLNPHANLPHMVPGMR